MAPVTIPPWQTTLATIAAVQTELARIAPYRDVALQAPGPARSWSIARAERRLGRRLPPSYRAFLATHDGWPRFFDGASLLGTRDLGKKTYADLAQAALEAAQTPVPAGDAPPSRIRGYAEQTIPFGIDPAGTTLFAFDPNHADPTGEMPVIAWIHEIGIRRASFGDFLVAILELCEADAQSLGDTWLKTA
jgi:hypothetical protein